jgi:hypothetical protein
VAVYRLFYSPISHIPGPKIAAVTHWYAYAPVARWRNSNIDMSTGTSSTTMFSAEVSMCGK